MSGMRHFHFHIFCSFPSVFCLENALKKNNILNLETKKEFEFNSNNEVSKQTSILMALICKIGWFYIYSIFFFFNGLSFRSYTAPCYFMSLIHSLTDCKWVINMMGISMFDLSLWMKSLYAEAVALTLIAIDTTCDWEIITGDTLLTSLYLPVPVSKWCRDLPNSTQPLTLAVCIVRAQVRSRQCLPLKPCHVESVPLHLFLLSLHLPFSVRWFAHGEEKLAVCSRRPNALCQPAVPMVSAEICLFCWRPHSMPAVTS